VHERAPHDVAARGIGERPEDAVDLVVGDVLIYNHVVVDSRRRHPASSASSVACG
jgi:hypothetical protein